MEGEINEEGGKKKWMILVIIALVVVVVGAFLFLNIGGETEEITVKVVSEESFEGEESEGVTEVVYWQIDERYTYEMGLLRMALDNTVDEYGLYYLKPHPATTSGRIAADRGLKLVELGEADIGIHAVTTERENTLLPIRVPLMQGLNGYRIFLIRDIMAVPLSDVETLGELASTFTAGFGSQWGDMPILEANNIGVEGFAVYNDIFVALNNGEVDYFPRGVNEIWGEADKFEYEYPSMMIEENVAFYYPFLKYFFVTPGNVELAERIDKGLNIAIEDGTFKELFLEYFGENLKRVNFENRKVFDLKNPTMSEREIDTSWWLNE
jgi:hypothetical protein